MARFNLMAGGPVDLLPEAWATAPGVWVGVDRGTLHLLAAGLVPVFTVGDYDSLTTAELRRVEAAISDHTQYAPEKDYTDTQLAVRRVVDDFAADEIVLYGATGGRIDHELANYFLPTEVQFAATTERLHLVDATNWIDYYRPGTHTLQPRPGYDYLGIVTLTPVQNLNIQAAKYPLQHWSSKLPVSWASNEFVADNAATISFAAGVVAVIYSRDHNGQKLNN